MIINRIIQGDNVKKLVVILLIFFFILNANNFSFADEIDEETDYIWLNEEIQNTNTKKAKELILNSKNVCVLERNSKQIVYGKNENKRVPMASTTKIMTAIVLLENLEKNNLTLNTQVEVCKKAASINGSKLGLKTGDKITINDLLYGLMLCSR